MNNPIPLPLNTPVVILSKFELLLHFHFWVNPSISNGIWAKNDSMIAKRNEGVI